MALLKVDIFVNLDGYKILTSTCELGKQKIFPWMPAKPWLSRSTGSNMASAHLHLKSSWGKEERGIDRKQLNCKFVEILVDQNMMI